MFRKTQHKIFFILLTSALSAGVCSQAQTPVSEKDFSVAGSQPLREKIFAHTDKDFYLAGEILWFKLYDVSADSLQLLNLSNVAYVEILNAQQKPVLQSTIALSNGTGNGSFYLTSAITSGNYIFRVYTNWMKNFGPDLFFQKTVTIVNTLVPVIKAANNDSDNYEIGFFPEGGNLVENIKSKIAFKVTDKFGNGVNWHGSIVDENNRSIVSFASINFGMGSFYFTPEQNHTYHAAVNINGKIFNKQLPVVYGKGYVMHITSAEADKISINVTTNSDMQRSVYLLAYAHNNLQTALMQTTGADGNATFIINKNNLPPGITHLTVFNSDRRPVCERLIFLRPEAMQLKLTADKNVYATRSEIDLAVQTNKDADLSMAVYLLDSLQLQDNENILSYLWLGSELKGRIESPQYYLNSTGSEADSALENLLLTQGWSKFRWDSTQNSQALFRFAPEHEGHIIEGKVTDKNSRLPAAGKRVYLSVPGQHFEFASSVSNDTGYVFFDIKDFYGSGELVVQTAKEDSMYHVEIIDPFSNQNSSWQLPPFGFSEDKLQELSRHNLAIHVQNAYMINELNRFISPALDSNAFYGTPDNKYFLDDYTRFNTMEEVLREYVTGVDVRIHQGNYSLRAVDNNHLVFFENDPLVLVDGVPILDMNKVIAYNPLKIKKAEVVKRKYYINSLTADGILSYSTYKGDLDGFPFDPGTIELSYDGLQLQREFYSPQYATEENKQSRVPDYRNVLYWSPQIITKDSTQISFYSSDIKGKYLAVVQGISSDGKQGYATTGFEVK